jgi:hypothetical protein
VYQESEIVELILVAFLTPMLVVGLKSITMAGKRWFIVSYLAMVCAYILTVAEGYWAPGLFNLLEHWAYAVSGIFLAVAAYVFLQDARRRFEAA